MDLRHVATLLACLLVAGCLGSGIEDESTEPPGDALAPLPPSIHGERTASLVSTEQVGCDNFDNVLAPCVKYPFRLDRGARTTVNLTWSDSSESMWLTVVRGSTRVAGAASAAGETSLVLVADLDVVGDHDLWVQGRAAYGFDASFDALGMPDAAMATSFALRAPVRIDGVVDAVESLQEGCVAVGPDGQTVLAGFHGRFEEFSPGYASSDGGATWERLRFPDAGVSGDCAVAMLEDGSWVFLGSTVVGATVLVSRDQGTSWSVNALAAPPLAGGWADRPWLLGFKNEIWLAYMPAYGSPGSIAFTKSTDHGTTWSIPSSIGAADGSTVQVGQFVRYGDDAYLPFSRHPAFLAATGAPASIEIAHTADDGDSWNIETVHDGARGDWPALAITESGHQALFFTDRDARLVAMSRSAGGAWSAPLPVHGQGSSSNDWPSADGGAGANATWLISEVTNAGESLWLGRLDAATQRRAEWEIGEGAIEFASVDHDDEGNAFVVWSNLQDRLFLRADVQERGDAVASGNA